ncbi:MAG: ATP-binding cassette domain-containing protein [Treponema sp.]|nr:ATP-binding cassette domain-containing protein [Treponema sp.]
MAAKTAAAGHSLCLSIKNLSFSYGNPRQPSAPALNALNNVSIDIRSGEYITLLGENGSGKSTLISCVNGLLAPPPGAVAVFTPDGVRLDPANEAHRWRIRTLTGMTLQNPDPQIIGCAVEEDVAFGPENINLSKAEIQSRVANALMSVGLIHLRDRPPHLLSGGEKQRLALAGILALDASIFILDEPTSMLDSHSAQTILALFDTLNSQGKTIIHITHDHDEALRSRRSIVLREGRVVFDGVPEAWGGWEEWRLGHAGKSAVFSGLGPEAPTAPVAVQFFSASHQYQHPSALPITGIHGVSLRIPRNSTTAVIGASGCGKTTLLKHINALLLPSSGNVVVSGADTLDKRVNLRNLRFRAALAVQSPESALFETYVADDVAFGPANAGLKDAKLVQRVKTAMDAAGLPFAAFADRETTSLSGGEKRRAALAGALAMDSEILLLDEPLAALDNKNKRRVMELIFEQQAKGKTVVVTTHSLEMAAFFDYVAVMDKGRIAAFGPPEAVFGELWNPDWELAAPKFQTVRPAPAHSAERRVDDPLEPPAQPKHRRKAGKPFFKTAFLGRFLDIDSPLRNLDPLMKMALLFVTGTISITGSLYAPPVVLLIVLLGGRLAGGIPCGTPLRSAAAVLPFLLLFVFLQTAFLWGNDSSPILFQPFQTGFFSFFSITSAELHRSLGFICRIASLTAALSLYLAVTPLRETISAINTLLSPLSRLGLPARDIAMMVGISIRFVPLLTEEAERIVTARISRGGKRGLRSSLALLVPLLLLSLERAETLANAMLLRLYKVFD